MNIYQDNTTNFNNNGLGFLTDIISASVVDEINGEYSLTIEYPINGHLSEYLVEENYIKCKVADGTKQVFIIKNVEKTFDTIRVYANHIFYLLIDNFLDNVAPTNLNGETFLNWILARTNYQTQFVGHSDIGITKSARYVRKNPVEAILGDDDNSMVNLFGGEIKRDNFDIYFNSRIGTDNGVKLLFGKNINEINITIDTTGVYTRIMPVGFDGLLLPELYVDSPLINNYLYPKICKYEFDDIKYDPEDEEAYHTLEEAYTALRNATAKLFTDGIDKPQINIKIDWIELSKTNEYKQYQNLETVHLGDTIYASILGMELETRVIKTTYNPLTDMIESFEIGTPRPTTASYQNHLEKQIEKVNPSSILEQAREDATELINSGFGGNVRIYPDRILIMDTDDETTARKVWQWNLNGLGYSSTGVNGQYSLAMTSNGQIVADFITTGHLNTSVIEGYDSLVEKVSKIYEFTNEISDTGQVILTNGRENGLISLSMTGEMESLFPSNTLYPADNLYPIGMNLLLLNSNGNQSINLPITYLYTLNDTSDEFQIYSVYNDETGVFDYKARVIRRIEVDAYGNRSIAQNETIIELGDLNITLYRGDTTVEMESFNNAVFDINYYINNDLTDSYATKGYVNSSIKQTADSIELEVSRKVGDDEIISKINQSAEQIQIQADKISLEGKEIDLTSDNITIDSDNFSVDENGNMTCSNADITGGNITLYGGEQIPKIKLINPNQTNTYVEIGSGILNGYGSGRLATSFFYNIGNLILRNSMGTRVAHSGGGSFYIDNNDNNTVVILPETGNITCVSLTQTSQEKYKKNFEKLKSGLDIINSTDIYRYNFDNEEDTDKKHIGLVIGDKYKYSKELTSKENDGVDIYSMVSVCFKAIQEQQEIIEKLQKRIEVLENEK